MAVNSMPSQGNDVRLIEAGFPCHQVGAETKRERDTGKAPPTHRLHVWWARRPLTPSRAAVLGSLLPADTDVDWFLRELGIEQVQADVNGVRWVLDDKLIERVVTLPSGEEVLPVDAVVQRALERERQRRSSNRTLIDRLVHDDPALRHDPVIKRWSSENVLIPDHDDIPDTLPVFRVAADPDWANRRIAWENEKGIRTADDKYGYARAFSKAPCHVLPPDKQVTILDPTAGGGSIPFEALRLGHRVIANDLNPVAAVILHATLDYPTRYGLDLVPDVEKWGSALRSKLVSEIGDLFVASPLEGDS